MSGVFAVCSASGRVTSRDRWTGEVTTGRQEGRRHESEPSATGHPARGESEP